MSRAAVVAVVQHVLYECGARCLKDIADLIEDEDGRAHIVSVLKERCMPPHRSSAGAGQHKRRQCDAAGHRAACAAAAAANSAFYAAS